MISNKKIKIFTSTIINIPFSQLDQEIRENRFIGNIDIKPSYQRDYIWTKRFKRDLIISILRGYPIGVITTRQFLSDKSKPIEIVDGQ